MDNIIYYTFLFYQIKHLNSIVLLNNSKLFYTNVYFRRKNNIL